MENKFLDKTRSLLSKINYLTDEDINEFEKIGQNLINETLHGIKQHGKIGLMYFIDQYNQLQPFYKSIYEKIEDHHKAIRSINFAKSEDLRLPLIGRFSEIWIYTMFKLKEIKDVYFPKELINSETTNEKTNKQDLEIQNSVHKEPNAPARAFFVWSILHSRHFENIGFSSLVDVPIPDTLSIKKKEFIPAICDYYNLKYNPNLQNDRMYSTEWNKIEGEKDQHLIPKKQQDIRTLIYPKIDQETKEVLESFWKRKYM